MNDKIDFSFQVLQTTIRTLYTDITRLDADVLVSSDDVYISMGRGVSAAIRMAAGDGPRDDARKHPLPLSIGSVLVTSAGRLRAKYIFHAITIDFRTYPDPAVLIPQLVQQVMDLAAMLSMRSLAVPLLGAGFAGLSEQRVFDLLLRSTACYLAARSSPLQEITIATYSSRMADHAAAEQKLLEELRPVCEQIERWTTALAPLNLRLALLQPLLATLHDDTNLKRAVEARIVEDRRAMCRLFECATTPEIPADPPPGGPDAALLDPQEYERSLSRLTLLLKDLDEDIAHLEELQRAEKRRLRPLERQRVQKGDDTAPEVLIEIEDITRHLEQRERQLQQLKDQREAAGRDLAALQRHRQSHQK